MHKTATGVQADERCGLQAVGKRWAQVQIDLPVVAAGQRHPIPRRQGFLKRQGQGQHAVLLQEALAAANTDIASAMAGVDYHDRRTRRGWAPAEGAENQQQRAAEDQRRNATPIRPNILTRQGLSQFSLTPHIIDTIFAECIDGVVFDFSRFLKQLQHIRDEAA
jgi:hypothetical protein